MNQVKEIERINERELGSTLGELRGSWHEQYEGCAWVFIGNLDKKLSEGDVICVFSQYGEVEEIDLVRDESTGVPKGFAFLKYEDWRSTVLAVDNFTGAKVRARPARALACRDAALTRSRARSCWAGRSGWTTSRSTGARSASGTATTTAAAAAARAAAPARAATAAAGSRRTAWTRTGRRGSRALPGPHSCTVHHSRSRTCTSTPSSSRSSLPSSEPSSAWSRVPTHSPLLPSYLNLRGPLRPAPSAAAAPRPPRRAKRT